MINFFPTLYQDELLISAICRYRYRCGYRNIRSLEADIYGSKNVTRSALLPMKIEDLVNRMPPNSKITFDKLIKKHTLFPFFTAYLSKEKTKEIYESMRKGNKISIERVLGFPASPIKPSSYLKYCPACYKVDMEFLEESYWRRVHQAPGVFYCNKHEVLLKSSEVLIIDGRINYTTATEACNDNINKDQFPKDIKRLSLEYGKSVETLFNSNFPRKHNDFITSFYIDRLRELGFTTQKDYIKPKELLASFNSYFPSEYLRMMSSTIELNNKNTWLRVFVIKTKKSRSPLRHLLLHQFLNIRVEELFNCQSVIGRKPLQEKITVPKINKAERREKWIQILNDNPNANRFELMKVDKGLYAWLRKHDLEWFDQVTPKGINRKKGSGIIDYKKRDQACLELVKTGYRQLINKEGKPIRICPESIRREVGANRWITDTKLIKTREFLDSVYENIDDFRIRKIKWSINEMRDKGLKITPYKVGIYAGFGGASAEIKDMILEVLNLDEN